MDDRTVDRVQQKRIVRQPSILAIFHAGFLRHMQKPVKKQHPARHFVVFIRILDAQRVGRKLSFVDLDFHAVFADDIVRHAHCERVLCDPLHLLKRQQLDVCVRQACDLTAVVEGE